MIQRLFACLIVGSLIANCADESNQFSEPVIPDSFTRAQYYGAQFDDLEDLCELLEHLYAQPNPDSVVVSELERFVARKVLIIRLRNFDINELGYEQVEGLMALLRVSESDKFGKTWNNPMVIQPSLDILRRNRELLIARREEIRSKIRVD